MSAPLAHLFRYNRWANLLLIDACGELTDEQLDARGSGTSGSIRELLIHVMGGQQTFILRTQGLPWRGKVYRYPMSFFLLHALEHGVEHRTEIKVTMAGLGVKRPDLDAWPYSEAAGYGKEIP